jgi:hypothetical protein
VTAKQSGVCIIRLSHKKVTGFAGTFLQIITAKKYHFLALSVGVYFWAFYKRG